MKKSSGILTTTIYNQVPLLGQSIWWHYRFELESNPSLLYFALSTWGPSRLTMDNFRFPYPQDCPRLDNCFHIRRTVRALIFSVSHIRRTVRALIISLSHIRRTVRALIISVSQIRRIVRALINNFGFPYPQDCPRNDAPQDWAREAGPEAAAGIRGCSPALWQEEEDGHPLRPEGPQAQARAQVLLPRPARTRGNLNLQHFVFFVSSVFFWIRILAVYESGSRLFLYPNPDHCLLLQEYLFLIESSYLS